MSHLRTHIAALLAVHNFGNKAIFRLISILKKHEVGWDEFWVSGNHSLSLLGLTEKQINSIKNFQKEYTPYSYQEWLQFRKMRVISYVDKEYPPLLLQCDNFPVGFFAKGNTISWDTDPTVAVVGARNMTAYGKLVTELLVTQLVKCGTTIVSGFMYGVDCTAHAACLTAQGVTVGVLGYGLEHVYPADQKELMQEWLTKGMIFLSPFAPGVRPKRGHFPARNRIVAGMSHAVLVAEAAEGSGSLITAGYAAQEGRSVCAVPGPITNPYTYGTRELLNQGAVLVSSANDILLEIESNYSQVRI